MIIPNEQKKQRAILYTPLKSTPKFEQRICALDFETYGKGGEALCVSYAVLNHEGKLEDSNIFIGENHLNRLIDVILEVGANTIWYSHYAQYDWRYMFEYIIAHRMKLFPTFNMRSETQVYQIALHPYEDEKQEIILRDSGALWPRKLDELTKQFAPDHAKLSGVIDFSKEFFDIHNQKHLDYALRDSESLALAMFNFNEKLKEIYGVPMGHTTAGTALKAWRRTINKKYYVNRATMEFMRNAYYGGFVFLTDVKEHKNCKSFDINSSYPNVMRKFEYPIDNPLRCKKYNGTRYPAIFHCRITAPDNIRIPIIPYRDSKGITKWSRGRIETYCTNYEIEFALAHGYTDLEIIKGFTWTKTCSPFKNFVDKAEEIRASYKNTPAETVVKLIQNALYGKFGTRQERRRIFFPESMNEIYGTNAQPLDENDILWAITEKDEDTQCHPAWASFITAHARLELFKAIYDDLGVENCLYGDTDSITVKENTDFSKLSIGNIYGQFKMDKQWDLFKAIAPKVYAGKKKNLDPSDPSKNNNWSGACKGIPVMSSEESEFYKNLYDEEIIIKEYDHLQSFWMGMKQGFNASEKIDRKSTDINNSGSWELHDDRSVWPKKIN